jgi:hypothetical protein
MSAKRSKADINQSLLIDVEIGVHSLSSRLHFPDFLKDTPELWLRRNAHSSISVQEGQPLQKPL